MLTGVYLALIVTAAIGIWAVYKTKGKSGTTSEYFTAFGFLDQKRIFFSVFATTFSAFTVVGLPAMFFAHGIGTLWFMWIGILFTPLTLIFLGKRVVSLSIENRGSFSSPVGLLTSGYGSKALTLIISLVTIVVLFPYLTLQIAGIGKFLVSISDGSLSYLFGTVFCCAIVGLYIFTGGAKADAETDLIQGIILVVGTMIVGFFLFWVTYGETYDSISKLNELGLLSMPGPRKYFTFEILFSYGIIFTLISISTPQVSQKLMGIENINDLKPVVYWYAVVGSVIVFLAGLIGFYAAVNLDVASPDFVTGDVIRNLAEKIGGWGYYVFYIVSILFIAGIISAAVSTIDSLLLAVSGIVSDNFSVQNNPEKFRLKYLTSAFLIIGLLFSSNPPVFIVTLAQIQLAGLTALIPCLLGPLFGVKVKQAGWMALIFGLTPVLLGKIANINFLGYDVGLIGLVSGTIGLLFGYFVGRSLSTSDG